MKKIIMLAVVLTTLATSAFSRNADEIGKQVLVNFNKTYTQAKNVRWESVGNYLKAEFIIDGQKMFAYYKPTGEQFAVTRNIVTTQLPIALGESLREKRGNQWLTDLFELSSDGETSYFATLNSADHITVLKSDVSGNWSVFKRTRRVEE